MRIAVLVKQIPKFEEMELGPDGRLRRDNIELEMNPYCRRAVSKGVELAAEREGSHVTVITLGPPRADDTLREAIAWGLARDVEIDGVLVTDPAFAGSDTLATAKALAAVLQREGPFDLVLSGRNSVDADTGQVPAEVAELCDLPFLTGVRYLAIDGSCVSARCEHDDGWLQAEVALPAALSCAERLCEPAKVEPSERAGVPAGRIRIVTAGELGPGPWGSDASPTWVGEVKTMAVARSRSRWSAAPIDEQVGNAVALLRERAALDGGRIGAAEVVGPTRFHSACVMVVAEPDRLRPTRELIGEAARLTGNVTAVTLEPPDAPTLVSWGADEIVHLAGDNIEEDVAHALAELIETELPWAILAASTAWGREVLAHVAAHLDCGLVGDAIALDGRDDRLIAWKPAFGGQLVAAIGCWSRQFVTVRPGVFPTRIPREAPATFGFETRPFASHARVRVLARTREDDLDLLAEAPAVMSVGMGVPPDEYAALEPLRVALGAELGATRKVTDQGWLPRSRQIGITGHAVAPRLLVSIGASGKFNHSIGMRAAATVLAINNDPNAPIFEHADAGIVGDWREVVPLLVAAL